MEKIFDGACIFYLFEVVTDEVIVFVSKIKLNVALFFLSLIVHCLLTVVAGCVQTAKVEVSDFISQVHVT